MSDDIRIEWQYSDVAKRLRKLGNKATMGAVIGDGLKAAALHTEGLIKIEITDQDLIDTGFMRNSVYVSLKGFDSYADALAGGISAQERDDQEMTGKMGVTDPELAAIIVGANYAAYVEHDYPFVRPVADTRADEIRGVFAKTVARRISEELG